MISVIAQLLPAALGVAISPFPTTAAILMLFSRRSNTNGLAYLAGWILGLVILSILALRLADTGTIAGRGAPSSTASEIKLVLGIVLVALGAWEWLHRPKAGVQPRTPRWLEMTSRVNAFEAFGLAFFLSAINPKSLALALAAALTIASAGLSAAQAGVALLAFIALGSLFIGIPVLYRLIAGDRANTRLESWKGWLIAKNALIMSVLLLLLGIVLIVQASFELLS